MAGIFRCLLGCWLIGLLLVQPVAAQAPPPPVSLDLSGFGVGQQSLGQLVHVSAQLVGTGQPGAGELQVTARIAAGYHIYSVTQKPGGPRATRIELTPNAQFTLAGSFQPDQPPQTHVEQAIWPDLPLEEHTGTVTWSVPLRLATGTDLTQLVVQGKFDTQACRENCVPLVLPFTARFAAAGQPLARVSTTTSSNEYRAEGSSVVIAGHVTPKVTPAGSQAQLVITAQPDKDWHIYAQASRDPQQVGAGKPTLIVVTDSSGLRVASIAADRAPLRHKTALGDEEAYYEQPVTWTVELDVPSDAKPGPRLITGIIGYQTCYLDQGCKPPLGARFEGELQIGPGGGYQQVALRLTPATYSEAAKLADSLPEIPQTDVPLVSPTTPEGEATHSLSTMILFGLLGGAILNLMPCVLPVVGLKLMSFVQQAGQSRARGIMLNLWYSAGMLSVFLILATLAVVAGLTWGEQFGNDTFNIVLAIVVFAMALSLLGIWELPIPGFLGGNRANEFAGLEGPAGAFFKGVLTTVLATPCTGPFMGTALAWAVRQPPASTYAVFVSIGVGMASPYLLIGAFPALIRFLPKPGMWMVTFKQVMGFVLLGTVIFLLTFIHPALIVPTITLLTGVAAGCWWISRTPGTSSVSAQLRSWAGALGFTAVMTLVSFGPLAGIMEHRFHKIAAMSGGATEVKFADDELPWQYFTPDRFSQLTDGGQTVMVDFTADWCLVCKTLEATVINTPAVKEVVEQNGIVPLIADYTKRPPEIKKMLTELRSNGVPVLAIFPAGRANDPIVFRTPYTQATLIEALRAAGPSHNQPPAAETALRLP